MGLRDVSADEDAKSADVELALPVAGVRGIHVLLHGRLLLQGLGMELREQPYLDGREHLRPEVLSLPEFVHGFAEVSQELRHFRRHF